MAETAETTQCPHCGGATQGLVCSFCGSLLSPASSGPATVEMQTEAVTFTASPSNTINVVNGAVVQP